MKPHSWANGLIVESADFKARFCFCLFRYLKCVSFQLETTEGTPDLGVTSYWTDAEGNVVFGPNTPKEKMKTTVTGKGMQKRKGERNSVCVCVCDI